jgi:hypothetical protein
MVGSAGKAIAFVLVFLMMSSAQCLAGCVVTSCTNQQMPVKDGAGASHCHQLPPEDDTPHSSDRTCSHDEATLESSKILKADVLFVSDTGHFPATASQISSSASVFSAGTGTQALNATVPTTILRI